MTNQREQVSDVERHLSASPRSTVKRASERGVYDHGVIHAILDEALYCHVGFVERGQPFVIPTVHVRVDDRLYIHGSPMSRMVRLVGDSAPACITVTLLDGLVLARSALHHSMNYRSVVILAQGSLIDDFERKRTVLEALTEHIVPGRWADVRQPTHKEIDATALVEFPISEASAKVRSGPPIDEERDLRLSVWAGVIPLAIEAGATEPDPVMNPEIAVPSYVRNYSRLPSTK